MKLAKMSCCALLTLGLAACGSQGGGQALEAAPKTTGIDSTFGAGGIVTTAVGSSDRMSRMLVQRDGKIVEVGTATFAGKKEYALVRHLSDGKLDESFGTGGKAHVLPGPNGGEVGNAALQGDGKIVVVGYSSNGSNNDISVLRFNEDGSVDQAWGDPGKLLSTESFNEIALGVAVQNDGKIVVAGSASSGPSSDFMFARFTPDGRLDNTFGNNGIVKMAVTAEGTAGLSIAQNVAVQPDGKLVVSGTVIEGESAHAANKGVMARLMPDGALDTSFGRSGFIMPVNGFMTSFLCTDEGNTYLGMYQGSTLRYRIYRFNQAGLTDFSFGGNGYVETAVPIDVIALAEDQQGRLIAAGQNPADFSLAVARFLQDGSIDTTFGAAGLLSAQFSRFDTAVAVAVDPMGRLLVGGFTSIRAPGHEFLLARFQP